jgi:predicted ATPase
MVEGLAELSRAGILLYVPDSQAMLAGVHALMGQPKAAHGLLDEALSICGRTGEVWIEAELHRQKADLLRTDQVAAETCFYHAIDTARRYSAKLFELRAAIGLARLWGEQARRAEARDLLAPVYGWFTEGFDTADLKQAKALLEELA